MNNAPAGRRCKTISTQIEVPRRRIARPWVHSTKYWYNILRSTAMVLGTVCTMYRTMRVYRILLEQLKGKGVSFLLLRAARNPPHFVYSSHGADHINHVNQLEVTYPCKYRELHTNMYQYQYSIVYYSSSIYYRVGYFDQASWYSSLWPIYHTVVLCKRLDMLCNTKVLNYNIIHIELQRF